MLTDQLHEERPERVTLAWAHGFGTLLLALVLATAGCRSAPVVPYAELKDEAEVVAEISGVVDRRCKPGDDFRELDAVMKDLGYTYAGANSDGWSWRRDVASEQFTTFEYRVTLFHDQGRLVDKQPVVQIRGYGL